MNYETKKVIATVTTIIIITTLLMGSIILIGRDKRTKISECMKEGHELILCECIYSSNNSCDSAYKIINNCKIQ